MSGDDSGDGRTEEGEEEDRVGESNQLWRARACSVCLWPLLDIDPWEDTTSLDTPNHPPRSTFTRICALVGSSRPLSIGVTTSDELLSTPLVQGPPMVYTSRMKIRTNWEDSSAARELYSLRFWLIGVTDEKALGGREGLEVVGDAHAFAFAGADRRSLKIEWGTYNFSLVGCIVSKHEQI
jgi:hypothetical protein